MRTIEDCGLYFAIRGETGKQPYTPSRSIIYETFGLTSIAAVLCTDGEPIEVCRDERDWHAQFYPNQPRTTQGILK